MNAGRELDALIAEKVFGFKVVGSKSPTGRWDKFFEQGENALVLVPPYSTNISAAWEIFLAIKKHGWMLGYLTEHEKPDQYVCQFLGRENRLEVGAYASTAPHAICLAALEAMKK